MYESAYTFGPTAGVFLVLLGVDNEEELLAAYDRITRKGVRMVKFHEPDYDTGWSGIASEPVYSSTQRSVFYPYEKLQLGESLEVHVGSMPALPTMSG